MAAGEGEFELIAAIRERLADAGIPGRGRVLLGSGDDAAVTSPGPLAVTSIDMAVEGVHFRLATASPADIGHKALAGALSDLAAMGAEPREAYVGLGLPEGFGRDACLELAGAMGELAAACGVAIAGGDITSAGQLVVSVTVVGQAVGPDGYVTRAGARPGQLVAVTGQLGAAAAGLRLLETGSPAALDPATRDALLAAQLRPWPRLETGRALLAAGAAAMIDISDGLLADLGHVATASGVELELDDEAIPIATGLRSLAAIEGSEALDLALGGGEDYELAVALAPERLAAASERVEATGTSLTVIGRVTEGPSEVRLASGRSPRTRGFDQLRR